MNKLFFCIALPCLLIITACSSSQISKQDREQAKKLTWDFYLSGKDTPWEYANNQVCSKNIFVSKRILEGKFIPVDSTEYDKSRKNIQTMLDEIEQGKNWTVKPEEYKIPFLTVAPVINGSADDWSSALTFHDEYPISSTSVNPSGALWKMAWDENYIYVFASFPDNDIVIGERLWHGDALEVFICPEPRFKSYWEVIVSPDGQLFDGLQLNSRWGGYIGNPNDSIKGLKKDVRRTADSYSVELAIPWQEMPGYHRGNTPIAGESIHFIMIRCNNGEQSSCRPILYGGHNIFGYIKGIISR